MPDANENVPRSDPEPAKTDPQFPLETFQNFFAAQTAAQIEVATQIKELAGRFDKLERTVENLALDVGMIKERDRRVARVPPHSDPVRPQTETGGSGFASYTWERKPATPRPS